MAEAIDVYERFQGNINWDAVRAAHIAGVWVKAANGSGGAAVSPNHYVAGARGAGLPVGGYDYVTGSTSAANQADVFADILNSLDLFGMAPMCDYEDATIPKDAAGARTYVNAYFDRLKARIPDLVNAIFYASGALLATICNGWSLYDASTGTITCTSGLTIYIDDAEYGINNGIEHTRTHFTHPVGAHQYTSNGHVSGVPTVVDRDSMTKLIPGKVKVEVPMAITQTDANLIATTLLDMAVDRQNGTYDGTVFAPGSDSSLRGMISRQDNAIALSVRNFNAINANVDAVDTNVDALDVHDSAQFSATATNLAALLSQVTALAAQVAAGGLDPNAFATALGPILAPLLTSPGLTLEQAQQAATNALRAEETRIAAGS